MNRALARQLLMPLVLLATGLSAAAEPRIDRELPVTEGLALWLDAARIPHDSQADPTGAEPDRPVGVWKDGSGHGRDVRPDAESARPRLIRVGGAWVVRFDGDDDHLRWEGDERTAAAVTVFVVAAPHENPGEFRGFLAANARGRRDYESGFTLDMSSGPSPRFDQLNVEGRGFGGAADLLGSAPPLGTLHVVEAVVAPEAKRVELTFDGQRSGERQLAPGDLRLDELTVGARYYTNGPGAQQVRGFLKGDIAEVLLYERVLDAREREVVRQYLDAKHAPLREALPATLDLPRTEGELLETVEDPPAVQMFAPGFTVRELPVSLTNVNNVKYRADGTLVALAYDGRIHLLSDTDGDGLEETVERFWDDPGRLRGPIGMALTPPGFRHGDGVIVAAKGKCVLIADTDGDGRGDREVTVADGWRELANNVDALGVAVDPEDHAVYFGLGTTNFTDAYLIGEDGRARYRLDDERGTILRVAPDLKSRAIVATGIRFPVALAFNGAGDLFCTDQEGATWLANGNPFDELLHVQKGRHYGFPPRHPRHLPGVVDEPSVFDYGPQHQSTCGLNFNRPVNGGPAFGPAHWGGDALVCGYSRGKLYRTKLAKTPAGYVARNQILAGLNMLTADACVSPQGDLVVAVHGGGPDWGSGPEGKGKLYKVTYAGREHPQPVVAWAHGEQEVRVAFDRLLDPAHLADAARRIRITYGTHVRAGDRFESLAPGYATVGMQRGQPRHDLPVHAVQMTSDRRTLLITTDPIRRAAHYAITLPGMGRPDPADAEEGVLPQHPQIDLDFLASGVMATWRPEGETEATWSGWLPHLDPAVSRALAAGSGTHDALWEAMERPGTLTLECRVDLKDMLRPAVQPGSRIDYEWPAEAVTLVMTSSSEIKADVPAGKPQSVTDGEVRRITITADAQDEKSFPMTVALESAGGVPTLEVSWHTREDERARTLPLHRLVLPWVESRVVPAESLARREIPELEGGDWARGRQVFFGEQAACSRCHAVHGKGGTIGPDLSNLAHRDYQSVLRDVTRPSFAINPDYVTHVLALADGRVLTGPVRTEGDALLVGDAKGQVTAVRRSDVEEMRASQVSVMPEGLPKAIGPERLKDLLTFLLTTPTRMPDYGGSAPPPPRPAAEVAAVLAGTPPPPEPVRPLRVVLVAGRKDHGPGEHDYPAWQAAWRQLLATADETEVGTAWDWPSAEDFASAEVLVFFQQGTWTAERARDFDAYLARGGGAVFIHYAVDGGTDPAGFAERIGLAWQGGRSKFRHGPLRLHFDRGSDHPVARNFREVEFHDESYWQLTGDRSKARILATGVEDGEPQPLFWTHERGEGRVFVSIPGHFSWTFDDPLFRILLLRGIAWTAREPVDRFNHLVTVGARVAGR